MELNHLIQILNKLKQKRKIVNEKLDFKRKELKENLASFKSLYSFPLSNKPSDNNLAGTLSSLRTGNEMSKMSTIVSRSSRQMFSDINKKYDEQQQKNLNVYLDLVLVYYYINKLG